MSCHCLLVTRSVSTVTGGFYCHPSCDWWQQLLVVSYCHQSMSLNIIIGMISVSSHWWLLLPLIGINSHWWLVTYNRQSLPIPSANNYCTGSYILLISSKHYHKTFMYVCSYYAATNGTHILCTSLEYETSCKNSPFTTLFTKQLLSLL